MTFVTSHLLLWTQLLAIKVVPFHYLIQSTFFRTAFYFASFFNYFHTVSFCTTCKVLQILPRPPSKANKTLFTQSLRLFMLNKVVKPELKCCKFPVDFFSQATFLQHEEKR